MKNYKVTLVSGKVEHLKADQVTYDDTANLMFLTIKDTLVTAANPQGKEVELVKCFNSRHYESYEQIPQAPLQITH